MAKVLQYASVEPLSVEALTRESSGYFKVKLKQWMQSGTGLCPQKKTKKQRGTWWRTVEKERETMGWLSLDKTHMTTADRVE